MPSFSSRQLPARNNSSLFTFLLGFLTALVLLPFFQGGGGDDYDDEIPEAVQKALSKNLLFSSSKFKGQQYWKEGSTRNAITLYETKFSRFQIHTVQLEDGKTLVDDWMWYDEGDNINILVETNRQTFLVFQQSKYGLTGQSYAVVGGIIEEGEEPLKAAQRELKEELGMESLDWKALGAFRAAANRGGGTTYPFWAKSALSIAGLEQKSTLFAEGESEQQKLLELTREQLLNALREGKFQEIKWTATVALALLLDQ